MLKFLGNENSVVVKDLNDVTDKVEIVAARRCRIEQSSSPEYGISTNTIKDMSKSHAGTYMAVVRLPSTLATQFITEGNNENWGECFAECVILQHLLDILNVLNLAI